MGSVFFGTIGSAAPMRTFKIGLVLSVMMFALLAAGVRSGLGAILAVYGFCAISAALAYAVLTPLFPPEMTGRVNTASNVLMFGFRSHSSGASARCCGSIRWRMAAMRRKATPWRYGSGRAAGRDARLRSYQLSFYYPFL